MNLFPSLPKPLIFICLLVAGALQTFTLAPYGLWLLGPVSIALILLCTQALKPSGKAEKGFLYGWIFGLGLFGSGASWVYVSINTYGNAPPVLAGGLTVIFVAGLALFSALNFWLYFKLRGDNRLINSFLFTAIWVLGDGFRTVFLTGFPWLFLGYSHLESPLSGWIPVIGVHGLTFIVALSGTALALLLASDTKQHKFGLLAFALIFWISGPALSTINWSQSKVSNTEESKDELSVALIQTNIPQELKWRRSQIPKTLKLLETMSEQAWQSDVIVWPETAVPRLYDQALPFLNVMSELAKANNSNIFSGIPFRHIDRESGRQVYHNSIVSLGAREAEGESIYHKQKLVPFGEYVPLEDLLRGLIDFFNLPMSDFRTGAEDQALLKSFDYQVAPFICYEVVYPDFVAKQSADADYLITISNDSWFGTSIGPLQHLEMAQMRAAENARYMVRGTNNGVSAIIDERGKITAQSEQFVQTILFSKIRLLEGRTPFSHTGSTPLFWFCALLVLVLRARR